MKVPDNPENMFPGPTHLGAEVVKAGPTSWYDMMEDYTSRSLTYDSDKLLAISGLASAIEATKDRPTYAAGLWIDDIVQCLQWRTVHVREKIPFAEEYLFPKRSETYRAPSWSWASIDQGITYGTFSPTNHPPDILLPKVVEFGTVAAGKDPHGNISDGFLLLSGCNMEGTASMTSERKWYWERFSAQEQKYIDREDDDWDGDWE